MKFDAEFGQKVIRVRWTCQPEERAESIRAEHDRIVARGSRETGRSAFLRYIPKSTCFPDSGEILARPLFVSNSLQRLHCKQAWWKKGWGNGLD
jgi:hypothetical protein